MKGSPAPLLALLLLGAAPQQEDDARALVEARAAAATAAARASGFEAEAGRAATRADRAHAAAEAMAARIDGAQARIRAAVARVRLVEDARRAERARLAAKQGAIAELTGALASMARRPAVLALAEPGTLDDAVHLRALLGATLPLVRARTASLRAEVLAGERLAREADAAVLGLRREQAALERARTQLAALEIAGRRRSAGLTRSAALEAERAQGLGEEARDLIDVMHRDTAAAGAADRLARLPGPILRPGGDTAGGALHPAPYRLPVTGRIVAGFGETADSGVRARGLAIVPRPGATVIAPLPGQVRYAGPFRSYGRIVILDHGGGWTTLVSGLATIRVQVGGGVSAGTTLGTAGQSRPLISVELRRDGQPVDLAPMLLPRRS